jgi:hypothetical protein
MILQGNISRRLGKEVYIKYEIAIRKSDVEKLGWRSGDHLDCKVTKNCLSIYSAAAKEPTEKLDYETFKKRVVGALVALGPQGGSWSEVRVKGGLDQQTPSPIYVKQMETEGCLKRFRNPGTGRFTWVLPFNPEALDAAESQFAKAMGKMRGLVQ